MMETLQTRAAFVLAALTLLGGCASMQEYSCNQQEERNRGVKPFTTYKLVEPRPGQATARSLSPGTTAQVPVYTISFRPGFTKPCTTLALHKDVVIYRSNDSDVVLNEIRDFYAEDGTLIASTVQDISAQVQRSGNYAASTPLPIPKAAPPGKYKIVNKLMYERRGSSRVPVPIARTEGFFYIIPME